ncbi:MAG: hypothetical protein GY699_26265 [Desulfobacteraceae bacterium]|nr:hypothetical protein [Desulfobacteraceae bacterium]
MQNRPLTNEQSRISIDTVQLYEAFREAFKSSVAYRGGMHWKTAKGNKYLFRSRGRYGAGKSLGVRSEKTEHIYNTFHKNKKEITDRFKQLRERVKTQARFCKAAKIQRVPKIATRILQELDQRNLLGNHVMFIGTHALYAYEAAAGAYFDSSLLATNDVDILWDVRSKLTLAIEDKNKPEDFIDILRKADKTFKIYKKQKFRVANANGYMVDLLKAMPSPITKNERDRIGGPNDLVAVEVMNMSWLLSSPKFEQIVIGEDGIPARMIVPDPRAFALHKFWVSQQQDREPIKKRRDKSQAMAVAQLILEYFPNYKFHEQHMKMFPPELLDKFKNILQEGKDDSPSLRL